MSTKIIDAVFALSAPQYAPTLKIEMQHMNWQAVIKMADESGVLPVVFTNISKYHSALVPEDVMSSARSRIAGITARNEYLFSQLTGILKALEAENIIAIPFKGAALAIQAYGNPSMRQFDDIDLIVPPLQIPRGMRILEKQGFTKTAELTEKELTFQIKQGWGVSMSSPDRSFRVELDAFILPHYQKLSGFDEGTIWQSSIRKNIGSTEMLSLPPENLLLMLCIHATKHCWERLIWTSDITAVIRSAPKIDWEELFASAFNTGTTRMLSIGLHLSRIIHKTPLPDSVLNTIDDDDNALELARRAMQTMENASHASLKEEIAFHLSARTSYLNRSSYMIRLVFTPSLADLRRSNPPFDSIFFCTLARPFRLFTKFLRQRFDYNHSGKGF